MGAVLPQVQVHEFSLLSDDKIVILDLLPQAVSIKLRRVYYKRPGKLRAGRSGKTATLKTDESITWNSCVGAGHGDDVALRRRLTGRHVHAGNNARPSRLSPGRLPRIVATSDAGGSAPGLHQLPLLPHRT